MESTTGEDEWELCNDDGFVYKRKKRRVDDLQPPPSAPPLPDPEAEEKTRRERKRKALLNLKARYQKEIDHWEHFSNALRAMQEKTQHRTNFDFEEMGSSLVSASKLADDNRLGGSESALDELLVQVSFVLLSLIWLVKVRFFSVTFWI